MPFSQWAGYSVQLGYTAHFALTLRVLTTKLMLEISPFTWPQIWLPEYILCHFNSFCVQVLVYFNLKWDINECQDKNSRMLIYIVNTDITVHWVPDTKNPFTTKYPVRKMITNDFLRFSPAKITTEEKKIQWNRTMVITSTFSQSVDTCCLF